MCREGQKEPSDPAEYCEALTDGYAKLSYLCSIVDLVVVKERLKLVVFVQSPYTQLFLERFFQELEFSVASIHANLSNECRSELVDLFNETDYPQILICEYVVCGQAINLHENCSDCFLYELASSTNEELQAWGRVRRIGQLRKQRIWRPLPLRSIDQWISQNQRKKFAEEILSWSGDMITAMQEVVDDQLDLKLLDEDIANQKINGAINLIYATIIGEKDIRTWDGLELDDLPTAKELEETENPVRRLPQDDSVDHVMDESAAAAAAAFEAEYQDKYGDNTNPPDTHSLFKTDYELSDEEDGGERRIWHDFEDDTSKLMKHTL